MSRRREALWHKDIDQTDDTTESSTSSNDSSKPAKKLAKKDSTESSTSSSDSSEPAKPAKKYAKSAKPAKPAKKYTKSESSTSSSSEGITSFSDDTKSTDSSVSEDLRQRHVDWIVDYLDKDFEYCATIVKNCRDKLITADALDYIAFWYIKPNKNYYSIKYMFNRQLQNIEASEDFSGGYVDVGSESPLCSNFLVTLAYNDNYYSDGILVVDAVKTVLSKAIASKGSVRYDPNHNSWIFSFLKPVDIVSLQHLLRPRKGDFWIRLVNVFYLHTVPNALSVESPFVYSWEYRNRLKTSSSFRSINGIMQDSRKAAELKFIEPAILGEMNYRWKVTNTKGLHVEEEFEEFTIQTVKSIKAIAITDKKFKKSKLKYLTVVPFKTYSCKPPLTEDFVMLDKTVSTGLFIRLSNLAELHKAFMSLVYPWKRPVGISKTCSVYLNSKKQCQLIIIEHHKAPRLDLDAVLEVVRAYGTVIEISTKPIDDMSLPLAVNRVPCSISHPNNKRVAIQFESEVSAKLFSSRHGTKMSVYAPNRTVIQLTEVTKDSSLVVDLSNFDYVQFEKEEDMGKKRTVYKVNTFDAFDLNSLGLVFGQLLVIYLAAQDINSLRRTCKTVSSEIIKQYTNPDCWKSKLEYYFKLERGILVPRNINWGTAYNLLVTIEEDSSYFDDTNQLQEYCSFFQEVEELVIELVNYNKLQDKYARHILGYNKFSIFRDKDKAKGLALIAYANMLALDDPKIVKFLTNQSKFPLSKLITDVLRSRNFTTLAHILRTCELEDKDWRIFLKQIAADLNVTNYVVELNLVPQKYLPLLFNSNLNEYDEDLPHPDRDDFIYKMLKTMHSRENSRDIVIREGLGRSGKFDTEIYKLYGINTIRHADINSLLKKCFIGDSSDFVDKWLLIAPGIDFTLYKATLESTIEAADENYSESGKTDLLKGNPLIASIMKEFASLSITQEISDLTKDWMEALKVRDLYGLKTVEWFFFNFDTSDAC